MESSTQVSLRYFPVKDDYVYAQLSTQMTEREYSMLMGPTSGETKKIGNGAMILCLDRSGSMSGKPYTALKEGAIMVAKSIYESKQFNEFFTYFYDDRVQIIQANTFEQYEKTVKATGIGGSTNFVDVFKQIAKYVGGASITDLSVIFFTDGQDTCNSKPQIEKELEKLSNACKSIRTRFLTIGFTSGHDSRFLNRIAQAGNELGNFFYIDTNQQNYALQIQDCLKSSLEMTVEEDGLPLMLKSLRAEMETKVILTKSYVLREGEEEGNEEAKFDMNSLVDLTNTLILREQALEDLQCMICVNEQKRVCQVHASLVQDASPEVVSKAAVKLINKQIFDLVQKLQSKEYSMSAQEGHEYVKQLDKELDAYAEMSFKVKDRELKREIMQEIQDSKEKTTQIMNILRNATGQANNQQIAQLNDLAYRTVRAKKGFQKKLDERAIKNEQLYKKLQAQVKEETQKMDFEKIRKEQEQLIEQLGACPLSCYDVIEAMQAGDCMCLCLDVGRPESALADPSKLVIKDIIPTYMASESFLDSAIYNLGKDQSAHGAFTVGAQGKLAMGLGRENITGIMPLYLFKEHWDIARRKAQPVYGFLCTLDVMGYASSQYFTVPFLVLLRCIQKVGEEGQKEAFVRVQKLVEETCIEMLRFNEEFRNGVVTMIKNFWELPENRTADIVPSIEVMLVQMYCLMKLDNYQQYLGDNFKLGEDELKLIFRYGTEEVVRRGISQNRDPLSKTQILKLLYPDFDKRAAQYMEVKTKELLKQNNSGSQESNDKFSPYSAQAQIFKSLDVAAGYAQQNQNQEEAKNEEQKQSSGSQAPTIDINQFTEETVALQPWRAQLADPSSEVNKAINGSLHHFEKRHKDLTYLAIVLGVVRVEKSQLVEMPHFENDRELFFAMLFQNLMQVKNSQRREAIANKTYVYIDSNSTAVNFLSEVLRSNFRNELASRETAVLKEQENAYSSQTAELFYSAPDIYYAAAVLKANGFYNGKGDMASVVRMMIKGQTPLRAAKEKLILIQMGEFHSVKIYSDKFKQYPDRFDLKPKRVFKLWISMVKKRMDLTGEDFKEAFPTFEKRVQLWNDCYDEKGKPTQNWDKFKEYCKESALRKKNQQKVKQAKKAKKGKI